MDFSVACRYLQVAMTNKKSTQADIIELKLNRKPESSPQSPPRVEVLQEELAQRASDLSGFIERSARDETLSFMGFERALRDQVFALARTAVVLFLALAEQRVAGQLSGRFQRRGRWFRRAPEQDRGLQTTFGVVRYWRTYARETEGKRRRGFHPLDACLGLTADRFTMPVFSLAVRMATKMSFAEAHSTLGWFMPTPPATEVIEQATLGMGRYTREWFETAPPPEGDGDVLVVMIDSKAVPTATAAELKRRRGKRRRRKTVGSARHRGRNKRKANGKKPRRSKGDKSKNGKAATLVVMYTLKRQGKYLLGPINKWVYASFAPKKHAFMVARREAVKRGFGPESGKVVQLVTDGDDDLAIYASEYLPHAMHTLDIMHVIERLWKAGQCIYPEGSTELAEWVEKQKDKLYAGRVQDILRTLRRRLNQTAATGPGNKGKRKRLTDIIGYLDKRVAMMNYDELRAADLEIGSGAVEGAVKYIIGRRCDHGGMRWIKQRAEAVLQLRCIDANGDWERFIERVHDSNRTRAVEHGERLRLQQRSAAELPDTAEDSDDALTPIAA